MLNVGQIVEVLETLYPLRYKESWDFPGLIVGDPSWNVEKIYCAVDPTVDIIDDAISSGAQLIVTHHPLYFKATHTVGGHTFRGSIVQRLIENHCALWVGHTNADSAYRGQGQVFVELLGLCDRGPLAPVHDEQSQVVVGLGRVADLATPESLRDFARRVADILPHTVSGVTVSGDLDKEVHRIAVLPGSGDSHIGTAVRSGADVYITSDLRHHPVLDARQESGIAFINTPHAAIEKLWLTYACDDVVQAIALRFGAECVPTIALTDINTDPWDMRI